MKYEINEETVALIPVNSHTTRVIELSQDCIVPQSTFTIMEENCEYYGSTYNGRIKAAQKILNFSYKLPLLVEETEKIIFFPTKASASNDCCWINPNFVTKREKCGKNIKVQFQNGVVEKFNMSKLSFENQLMRANMLDSMLTKRINRK